MKGAVDLTKTKGALRVSLVSLKWEQKDIITAFEQQVMFSDIISGK